MYISIIRLMASDIVLRRVNDKYSITETKGFNITFSMQNITPTELEYY